MESTGNNFDKQVDDYLSFMKNEYVTAGVSLFLILYAGVIAPKLSPNVLAWFDNWIVQIALFFAIVYISNKNATVALIAAIAVLVTLMVANNQITLRTANAAAAERFCSVRSGKGRLQDLSLKHGEEDGFLEAQLEEQDQYNGVDAVEEDGVDGILDEDVEEVDNLMSGFRNAVHGGATTSRGGPKMHSKQESDYPTHRQYEEEGEAEQEQRHGQLRDRLHRHQQESSDVVGVEDSEIEDEDVGSSLDESENAGVEEQENQSVESIVESEAEAASSSAAEDALRAAVERVTAEVEEVHGERVPEETQEEVVREVKHAVSSLAYRGRPVAGYDVIRICREVYRKKF